MDRIEEPRSELDRQIYVMPAFVTFQVADLAASTHWYVHGLGFVVLAELPGPDGQPGLVHLRRFRYQDILLVPSRDTHEKRRGAGVRLTVAAGNEDLDARAARAAEVGGGTIEGPLITPWNTLDLVARDPDGYEVVFTSLAQAAGTGEADQTSLQVTFKGWQDPEA